MVIASCGWGCRLYGDKAGDIIDGLKKNPIIAVPLVLRRLRAKEEEWREARHGFNKVWREQNEKFYLKSLDHQGLNFKQADIKAIRSKQLLNEIEQAFDERAEQLAGEDGNAPTGPHLTFTYSDPILIDDVTNLIMHHMKRHTGIHKEEKTKIKALLLHFLPDMFHTARGEFSDDEGDDMETDEGEPSGPKEKEVKEEKDKESQQARQEPSAGTSRPTMNGHLEEPDDDLYSMAFLHSNWYLFFRLHHMAAERLHKINSIAQEHIQEAETMRKERKESTAIALRLKQPLEVEPEEYYPYFLDMVKSLLDGNLESTAYEDQLREIFGINAYIAFTMDKIIMNLVRQLQHITSDEVGNKVNAMYQAEAANSATGGRLATQHLRTAAENVYQRKAEQLLVEDSCFKITMYKQGCRMAIEMMDVEATPSEDPGDLTMWNDYIEKYTQDSASADLTDRRPVFLNRNVRQFAERQLQQTPALRPEESDSDPEREKDGGDAGQVRYANTSLASAIRSHEKMGCHFPPNSYKRFFIFNSASIFYRTPRITLAKESHKAVTLRKHTQFERFLSRWRREHVSSSAEEQCQQWLLGRAGAVADMRPCRTLVKKLFHTDRAPYYQYCKYQVEVLDSPKPIPPTVTTAAAAAPPTAPPVLAKPPPPTAPAPSTGGPAGENERE